MSDSSTGRAPAATVWPCVGFPDVDAGIRFLTEGLGFVVSVVHRDDDGIVEHAEARWPDGGGIMFGSRGKPGAWGALGPQGVYVVAAAASTVDAAWQRVSGMPGIEGAAAAARHRLQLARVRRPRRRRKPVERRDLGA
jgi:hypothetical protein